MPYEFKQIRRIEFADTDMGGIVHFSNFYRFMEVTEHAFYRSLGLRLHAQMKEGGPGMPRVAAACEFRAPLRYNDEVEIHLLVREKRSRSLSYSFVLSKLESVGKTEVARGTMTAVSVSIDPASGGIQSVPLPPDFADRIEVAPADLLAASGE